MSLLVLFNGGGGPFPEPSPPPPGGAMPGRTGQIAEGPERTRISAVAGGGIGGSLGGGGMIRMWFGDEEPRT